MTHKYSILFQQRADLPPPDNLNPAQLEHAAQRVLELSNVPSPAMLSVIIGTDAEIQALNLRFRGIDAPTDILSFPAEPLPPEIEVDEPPYLGDIMISLPYVVRRVAQEAHSIQEELMLLIVHGTLHLLGYDHDTNKTQQLMWAKQDAILKSLGIELTVPDYIHEDPT